MVGCDLAVMYVANQLVLSMQNHTSLLIKSPLKTVSVFIVTLVWLKWVSCQAKFDFASEICFQSHPFCLEYYNKSFVVAVFT